MPDLVFFDFDDTLIATNSFNRFIVYLYKVHLRRRSLLNLARVSLFRKARLMSAEDFKDGILFPLRGMAVDDFGRLCVHFSRELPAYFIPEALNRLKMHQRRGDCVVVISGALHEYLCPLADSLDIQHVVATKVEYENGVLTGRIVRPQLLGETKVVHAAAIAQQMTGRYNNIISYSDSLTDLPLLEFSDIGYLVNARPNKTRSFSPHIKQLRWCKGDGIGM